MELQYEELNCYSCVLDTVIRREESRESIVPDSMPDIGTVLTVTASPMLHKTWIENGAVIVEGSICAAVLYEPEGGGGQSDPKSGITPPTPFYARGRAGTS